MAKRHNVLERWWLTFCLLVVRIFFGTLYRVKVTGKENLPKDGGTLIASNHVSFLDPLLIPSIIMSLRDPEMIYGPAKAELYRIPLLGQLLYSLGIYPVQRNSRDIRAMKRTIALLKSNKVMIFPEGERSMNGQLQEGNRFVGKMVYDSKPVVIPTAVKGTEKALPRGKCIPRFFTRLEVIFGPPLDLSAYYAYPTAKMAAPLITERIMDAIGKLLDGEK
jgi:1-acyl-sn-glycerol-3-phosphate acyltransferase